MKLRTITAVATAMATACLTVFPAVAATSAPAPNAIRASSQPLRSTPGLHSQAAGHKAHPANQPSLGMAVTLTGRRTALALALSPSSKKVHSPVALPLASVADSTIVAAPGTSVSFTLETMVQSLVGKFAVTILPATVSHGFIVIPETPIAAGQTFLIRVPADAPDGVYHVMLTPAGAAGQAAGVRPVAVKILVERSGSILTYFNDTGIANYRQKVTYSFDDSGNNYSAALMAQNGLRPGAHVTVDGVQFLWEDDFFGSPDNILTDGQTVRMTGQGTELAILGAATNGPSRGVVVIHYTDGDEEAVILGLNDWTLNGGTHKKVLYGNRIAFAMRYRLNSQGRVDNVHDYIYFATLPLIATKTVSAITLPGIISQGALHIFAMTIVPASDGASTSAQ